MTSDPAHFPPRPAEFCRAPHPVMAPLDVQAPSVVQSLPNFQIPKCLWDEYAALHCLDWRLGGLSAPRGGKSLCKRLTHAEFNPISNTGARSAPQRHSFTQPRPSSRQSAGGRKPRNRSHGKHLILTEALGRACAREPSLLRQIPGWRRERSSEKEELEFGGPTPPLSIKGGSPGSPTLISCGMQSEDLKLED